MRTIILPPAALGYSVLATLQLLLRIREHLVRCLGARKAGRKVVVHCPAVLFFRAYRDGLYVMDTAMRGMWHALVRLLYAMWRGACECDDLPRIGPSCDPVRRRERLNTHARLYDAEPCDRAVLRHPLHLTTQLDQCQLGLGHGDSDGPCPTPLQLALRDTTGCHRRSGMCGAASSARETRNPKQCSPATNAKPAEVTRLRCERYSISLHPEDAERAPEPPRMDP